jgi:hypothetical protein
VRPRPAAGRFRFRTGVDPINVAATVTDRNGQSVAGLRKEDFAIYEDGQPREIGYFSADRVPVSLGIALDTSGSMEGEKIENARRALDRFLYDLLDPVDEIFVFRFDSTPDLIQDWTTDRDRIARALSRVNPGAAPRSTTRWPRPSSLAQAAFRKKALVVISDGNDTSSEMQVNGGPDDSPDRGVVCTDRRRQPPRPRSARRPEAAAAPPPRLPIHRPSPGGRRLPYPPSPPAAVAGPSGGTRSRGDDRSTSAPCARSRMTAAGGRDHRSSADLDPATAKGGRRARKASFLGYEAPSVKDGRWHSIASRSSAAATSSAPGEGTRERRRRHHGVRSTFNVQTFGFISKL